MKVWIDLANSPYPLLFAPIARRLGALGHEVLLTVRDNAQTVALARERWPEAEIIGEPSPSGKAAKTRAMAARICELRKWGRAHRPTVALSHNSYAQIVAARSLGLRVITAMDYEHQPSNHVAVRFAHTILLPEALNSKVVRWQGARAAKVYRYPGLKSPSTWEISSPITAS